MAALTASSSGAFGTPDLPVHHPDTGSAPWAGASVTSDRISLHGVSGFGRHGVYEVERERGQRFAVDVDLALDLQLAAASDDLAQTVDYAGLAEQIVADIERDPVHLIEALALRIAGTCLRSPLVQTATVTVHKPDAIMPVRVLDVSVTITRSREP